MRTKNLFIVTTIITATLTLPTSCDNRKDILPDLEKSASAAPSLQIRRHKSGQPFVTSYNDTSLVGTGGYRLDYTISGNADLSTLDFQCINGCSNVTYTQLKKDSGFVVIYVNNGTSASFTLSVSNKFDQKSYAYFSLTTINQKPAIKIRNYNLTIPFSSTVSDSIKTSANALYSLELQLLDDNATYSNIVVKKKTGGDINTVIISSAKIDFNFSTVTAPKSYNYSIYVVDPLGKTSDTCHLTVYAFKNLPPLILSVNNANFNYTTLISNTTYLGKYQAGSGPWNAFLMTWAFNGKDQDQTFGGFIKAIHYRVQMNYYKSSILYLFDENFKVNYTALNNSPFGMNIESPFSKNGYLWTFIYNRVSVTGYVLDNDNDSTYFSQLVNF